MTRKTRYPHKFRFQVVANWLINTYPPTTALDIGGGNGLLTHLLNSSDWHSTVVDPSPDRLVEWKYKDINTNKQIKLSLDQRSNIPRIQDKFTPELIKNQRLLIGLHAHGCNIGIIDTAHQQNLDFTLIPCCVIDEPLEKQAHINWLDSLFEYAQKLNLNPKKITLPFVGQSTVIYTQNHLIK